MEGLKFVLHRSMLYKVLQASVDGCNVPMRAGSQLRDSVVASRKVIHLSVEGLKHVLEVGEVVGGWVG